MPTVETAFFCEKAYVMNDGKHFAAGLMPGIIAYSGPVQQHFPIDAYAAVRFDHAGKHKLDIMVSTEKGQTIAMSSLECEVGDPRFPMQIALGNLPLPLVDGETYLLSVKEGASPWTKACALRMSVTFKDDAALGLKAS